jgi:hypothetical protein
MTKFDTDLMEKLQTIANNKFDGHLTILKFTTNWRVGWDTPMSRCDIDRMWPGKTFAEAATTALAASERGEPVSPRCQTHEWLTYDGISGECPFCGDVLPEREKVLNPL